MKKWLFFFLGCAMSIITCGQINSMDISKDSVKSRASVQEIQKPGIQANKDLSDVQPANLSQGFHKKHRLIAAILALPIPFGIFGLHRMYLHTSPGVPLVYIATAGGLFGVLPFIDFVLILLSRDIHLTYTSNRHIFMWQKR